MMQSSQTPSLEPFEEIVSKVLAGVPPGSSPILSLLPEIWASPQALAPAKKDLLLPLLRQVKLYCTTGKFIFSTSGDYINVSDGALNLIWCASYVSWFIYQAFGRAKEKVVFDDDPDTVAALDLYQWSIRCVREGVSEPWPEGAPIPTRTPPHGSALHVANEVFLPAIGWMFLHEFGHLAHNHPLLTLSMAKQEEKEADLFAVEHVLSGVTDDAIRFKVSVGMVVANIVVLLIDLQAGRTPSFSHPPVEERLADNLRGAELETNDRIHAFATALVQFHLHKFEVPYQLEEHDRFGHFVDDFCLALNRWRKQ